MESTVFYKTRSGNRYLYDNNTSTFMQSHALFDYFYRNEKTGSINLIREHSLETASDITEINNYSQEEIEYYHKKYMFLKHHGYFEIIIKRQRTIKDIEPIMIGHLLANIKQITFEVTECCNLKCKYCAYNDLYQESENRVNKHLCIENAKAIIDYLYFFWNSDLNQIDGQTIALSFYGGEPLLNFGFINNIIQYVKGKPDNRKKFRYTRPTEQLYFHCIGTGIRGHVKPFSRISVN